MNIVFEHVTEEDKLRLLAAAEGITKAVNRAYRGIHKAQELGLDPEVVCDVTETEVKEALCFNQCIIDFLKTQN